MSHFDDVEFVFWGDSPKSVIGAIIFVVIAVGVCIWAANADATSEKLCREHGEKYVDSRESYTLCERADGTIIRR
jgi:hypothetical protein